MLEYLYEAFKELKNIPGQGCMLVDLLKNYDLPKLGVYYFFEEGELRANSDNRIVRVGTHALKAGSKSTLRDRLRAHLGSSNGNGNHRGSIFRLHVGTALLESEKIVNSSWGIGASRPEYLKKSDSLMEAEREIEERVSKIIGKMRVFWLKTTDQPGLNCSREIIERDSIVVLANQGRIIDPPSDNWLGKFSKNAKIRNSGLWNVEHVQEIISPKFKEYIEKAIHETRMV